MDSNSIGITVSFVSVVGTVGKLEDRHLAMHQCLLAAFEIVTKAVEFECFGPRTSDLLRRIPLFRPPRRWTPHISFMFAE